MLGVSRSPKAASPSILRPAPIRTKATSMMMDGANAKRRISRIPPPSSASNQAMLDQGVLRRHVDLLHVDGGAPDLRAGVADGDREESGFHDQPLFVVLAAADVLEVKSNEIVAAKDAA